MEEIEYQEVSCKDQHKIKKWCWEFKNEHPHCLLLFQFHEDDEHYDVFFKDARDVARAFGAQMPDPIDRGLMPLTRIARDGVDKLTEMGYGVAILGPHDEKSTENLRTSAHDMLDKIFDGGHQGNISATVATIGVYAEAVDDRKSLARMKAQLDRMKKQAEGLGIPWKD